MDKSEMPRFPATQTIDGLSVLTPGALFKSKLKALVARRHQKDFDDLVYLVQSKSSAIKGSGANEEDMAEFAATYKESKGSGPAYQALLKDLDLDEEDVECAEPIDLSNTASDDSEGSDFE